MKKILLATVALVAMASAASALSIKDTKHDLSMGSLGAFTGPLAASTSTNQICIFCHTPHNPVQNVPLWNRTNPLNTGWTMYASPTISTTAKAKLATGTFDADSISLFCMSCHDGATAMGAFVNHADLGADATPVIPAGSKAMLGGGTGKVLTKSHPVGFNFETAATEDTGLHTLAYANGAVASGGLGGSAFFGSGANLGKMIECASCHKVHDNAFPPFLRTTNAGSFLCLACHDK